MPLGKREPQIMSMLKIGEHELLPFDMSTKPIMDSYLKCIHRDTSDYTFAGNYLWLSNGSGFYSIIEDTFCFFLLTNGQLSMILPPIGEKRNSISAMTACFNLMEENNSSASYTKIEYVDEYIVSCFFDTLEAGSVIFDQFEDFIVEKTLVDYVYDSQGIINLKGNNYSSKRNEINKFKKIHSDYQLEQLNVEKHAKGIFNLVNEWISERMKYMPYGQEDAFLDGIYSERIAIKRMINDYENLDLKGLVIIIDGQIKGFTVGERINDETASIIIEKTDFNILGCAQFIFREFAKFLFTEYGVSKINVGDDMGFENLKKVKMSYRPSMLLPKYTIYRRY